MIRKYLWILCCLIVSACTGTAPQSPSQRTSDNHDDEDSAVVAFMQLNMQMAQAADRDVAEYVRHNWNEYVAEDMGYWRKKGIRHISERQPQEGEHWSVRTITSRFDGVHIEDRQEIYTIGQSDAPMAVKDAIMQMYKSDTVFLAVPWYVGYGAHGKGKIGAYENVLITVILE